MVIETESYLTEEPSIEVQSGTEILESLGLKENDLWGKRVVIMGESNALKTVLQTSEHKVDFEFVSPETIIAQESQPDNQPQFLQKNSIDYIIDLGQDPTGEAEVKAERYKIDEYRQMVEALHHHGKIIVPEPIKNRAFPIAARLARNFIIFFDPERQSNPALRLMRIENIIFTAASKKVTRDTKTDELWSEDFWWGVIEDLTTSEPPQLLERDVATEFCANLQSRLREDYEYKTGISFGDQPHAPNAERILLIEKVDARMAAANEAIEYLAETFQIYDLSPSELKNILRIADETITTRKRKRDFLERPENKNLKTHGTIFHDYWEIVARFLGEMYGIDFGNSRSSVIAEKTRYGQTVVGSKRIVRKYLQQQCFAKKTFDVFQYPSIDAMRQAIDAYKDTPEMGLEDQSQITTRTEMGVSETLINFIKDARRDAFESRPKTG